ncbi:hypothetical protein THAOC_12574, partial [Thalassiosira oceanica]
DLVEFKNGRGPGIQTIMKIGEARPVLAEEAEARAEQAAGLQAAAAASSRATDRPTESLNQVAAVSTEDIIANRAAPPPGPSPPPGGGAVRIRDIQFPATSAARESDTRLRKNCS